ncbi:MAG: helix-turn-helix domain-containing protein [Bacteroidia bacterium]|nr:helix-turn-helix domain-containing protein [Bacteroidia bacterium]
MNYQLIGHNIKTFRESMTLSQVDLAGFLSVTREQISYYETGKRNIPLPLLERLSSLFGVELSDLLTENPAQASTLAAFAFRAEGLEAQDLESLAEFQKIVKNYLKIHRLSLES